MAQQSKQRIDRILRSITELVCGDEFILDIGCGDGATLSSIADTGGKVVGIDYDYTLLERARMNGYNPVLADLSAGLPFDSSIADIIVAGEIIEHLIDTDNFLEECRRVLKPGGQLLLSTPNVASLTSRFRVVIGQLPTPVHYASETLDGKRRAGGRGHLRAFNKSVLIGLLEKHGFKVEGVATDVITIPKLITIPWPYRLGSQLGETLVLSARAQKDSSSQMGT